MKKFALIIFIFFSTNIIAKDNIIGKVIWCSVVDSNIYGLASEFDGDGKAFGNSSIVSYWFAIEIFLDLPDKSDAPGFYPLFSSIIRNLS